jgi:CheY-like chemotaxis protein
MSKAKAKILVVDDEPSIRISLSLLLGEIGYSVSTAENGLAALASFRNEIPDILITDLYMPGMTGFELASVVRRRFPAVRTIAMSGAFRDDAVPAGVVADAFFPKGGNVTRLLRILQSLNSEDGEMRGREPQADIPIWIQPNGYDRAGSAQIAICCPECLRVSWETDAGPGGEIREAICVHCRSRILYSIVPAMDSGSGQVLQRGRSRGLFKMAEAPQFQY